MADVDTASDDRGTGRGLRIRRARPRVGIRIDMTPMVDVAFLLLIFFMVTTVFRQPLAMEVNMPDPDARVEVPESNVLTILVGQDDSLRLRRAAGLPETVAKEDLPALFLAEGAANPQLIVLVKLHRDARYESFVDLLDLLEDAHMTRFSLVPMSTADVELFESAR